MIAEVELCNAQKIQDLRKYTETLKRLKFGA